MIAFTLMEYSKLTINLLTHILLPVNLIYKIEESYSMTRTVR